MPIAVLLLPFLLLTSNAQAQPVYRCEINGRISYAHEPCVGAKAIDTTPTQGLDRWSGRVSKGRDVRQAEWERDLSRAVQPITGLTPEQSKVVRHRSRLAHVDKLQCELLDLQLPGLEHQAAQAVGAQRAKADAELFKARMNFRDLRC